MRIKLIDHGSLDHDKKIRYWKTVMLRLNADYTGKKNGSLLMKDKLFREWLSANWGIKLLFRSRKPEGWVERVRYGENKVTYVHSIEIQEDFLSLLVLKFPTDLFSEEEKIFNQEEKRYDSQS